MRRGGVNFSFWAKIQNEDRTKWWDRWFVFNDEDETLTYYLGEVSTNAMGVINVHSIKNIKDSKIDITSKTGRIFHLKSSPRYESMMMEFAKWQKPNEKFLFKAVPKNLFNFEADLLIHDDSSVTNIKYLFWLFQGQYANYFELKYYLSPSPFASEIGSILFSFENINKEGAQSITIYNGTHLFCLVFTDDVSCNYFYECCIPVVPSIKVVNFKTSSSFSLENNPYSRRYNALLEQENPRHKIDYKNDEGHIDYNSFYNAIFMIYTPDEPRILTNTQIDDKYKSSAYFNDGQRFFEINLVKDELDNRQNLKDNITHAGFVKFNKESLSGSVHSPLTVDVVYADSNTVYRAQIKLSNRYEFLFFRCGYENYIAQYKRVYNEVDCRDKLIMLRWTNKTQQQPKSFYETT